MSTDLVRVADIEQFAVMEDVAKLRMQGYDDTQVAKHLNMTRPQVKKYYQQFKDILKNDGESRDRARDQLNLMVAHYDGLIRKLYDLLEELEQENFTHQIAAQRNAAIKQIGDLEAKRLDSMQKAGILDASDLGDELAEMEEQRDMVINILREDLCPSCRRHVMGKIGEAITKNPEVVVVYDE